MTAPILRLMEKALSKTGKGHLTGCVSNYFCLWLALGMVSPTRIDDIWDPDAAAYKPRLSQLLSSATSSGSYTATRDPLRSS